MATAGIGILAATLAPGMLSAAGRNVAPVAAGNPLFTGEIGSYTGFTMVGTWYDEPADCEFFKGDQWSAAQRELFTRGQATVKISPGKKAAWIPFNRIHRRG